MNRQIFVAAIIVALALTLTMNSVAQAYASGDFVLCKKCFSDNSGSNRDNGDNSGNSGGSNGDNNNGGDSGGDNGGGN